MPVSTSTPSWFVAVHSRSTSVSPPSSRLPVTLAANVIVSPGQTCFEKRTWKRRMASGPNQSFTTRAISPAVSIPWPNTDGFPT